MEKTYSVSLRCFYPKGNHTTHRQTMPLRDIKRWIEAYSFTHPDVESISAKIWLKDERGKGNAEAKQ